MNSERTDQMNDDFDFVLNNARFNKAEVFAEMVL